MISRRSMPLFLLLVLTGILMFLWSTVAVSQAQPDDWPVPLPSECGGIIDPSACCVHGYIYYQDQPVEGVSVVISSTQGAVTVTTSAGPLSTDPYYAVSLHEVPLLVSPGDAITITASFSGMVSSRAWQVQSGGQQVDLGLIAGYQSPALTKARRTNTLIDTDIASSAFPVADTTDSVALTRIFSPTESAFQTNGQVWQDATPHVLWHSNADDEIHHSSTLMATGPQLVSIMPPRNAVTAPLTTTISATYNQPISPTTVTSRTFTIHAMQSGLITQTQGVYSGTISLVPPGSFMPGELVQVSTTTSTLSLSGQSPISPTVWQFRVSTPRGSGAFVDSFQQIGSFNGKSIALGDLDSDGDLDAFLVNGDSAENENYVLVNDGLNAFSPQMIAGSSNPDLSVALGDVDLDGDLDAFVTSTGGPLYRASLWLNDGSGNFTKSEQPLSNCYGTDIDLADLDGDSDLDAFIACGNGYVPDEIWLNDGAGVFSHSGQNLGNSYSGNVELGDLDSDGDLDAFVKAYNHNDDTVWLNEGFGIFTLTQTLSETIGTRLASGDIDGDGDLDVLSGERILFNNGRGIFSVDSHTIDYGQVAKFEDIDGDGDLDIFVATQGANSVWLNDGFGSFTDTEQRLGWHNSQDVALGDADEDGDLDAFIVNEKQALQIWLNQDPLTIEKTGPAIARAGEPFTYTLSIVNNSFVTATQLLITDTLPSGTHHFSGGTLAGDVVRWTLPSLPPRTEAHVSLVVTATSSAKIVTNSIYGVVANGGIASSGQKTWITLVDPFTVTNTAPSGNGRIISPERVISTTFNATVDSGTIYTQSFVVWGRQTGIYTQSYSTTTDTVTFDAQPNYKPGEEIVVSLNHGIRTIDGRVLKPYTWQFRSDVLGGSGLFAQGDIYGASEANLALALGDLDGDGDLDAIIGHAEDGQGVTAGEMGEFNQVLINDGTGQYSHRQWLGSKLATGVVEIGDLDGDGDLDVFFGNDNGQSDQVWFNNGLAYFEDSGQRLGSLDTNDVALGDLDGDGDLDTLIVDQVGRASQVWLNDGSGYLTYSGYSIESQDYNQCGIEIGDVDNDGDPDAILSVSSVGGNQVWLNDGMGHFSDSGQRLGQGSLTSDAKLQDLDQDGDLDAFIVNRTDYLHHQGNQVWINDGTGHFFDSGQNLGATGDKSRTSVSLGDLDGDQDLDAYVTLTNNQSDEVWLNNGDGTFVSSEQTLPPTSNQKVSLGDLDCDGDIDAFFVGSDQIGTWLNQNVVFAQGVYIDGILNGLSSTSYTFTATVSPPTATLPFTYTWQATDCAPASHLHRGISDTYTCTWSTDGPKLITVTAANAGGIVTTTAIITIAGYTSPTAAFTATALSGSAPLLVTFVDQSSGAVVTWDWSFGDGRISGARFPAYEYETPGVYSVSLTVSGPGGTGTVIKADLISVAGTPPSAIIHAISPNPAFWGADVVTFIGSGVDNQGTAPISGYHWRSDLSGTLASTATFTLTASALALGDHTIYFQVQDTQGVWSAEVTRTLTISSSPPVVEIRQVWWNGGPPSAAPIQGQHVIHFNGDAYDSDEQGYLVTSYQWTSNLDGVLSAQEDFWVAASSLSTGTHVITFQAQDDEGEWSEPVSETLTVLAPEAGMRTAVLVNSQRLASLYGASLADEVVAHLEALVTHENVDGLLVHIDQDPEVAAAYALWDAEPTSTERANAVTTAIKNALDAQWALHPNLEYLVIVGDDRVIPFHRVPDRTRYPESNYQEVPCTSRTGAALCADMTLTDDYYADAMPTRLNRPPWNGHDLYIPDLGTGRLVETPAEIMAQIDAFLAGSSGQVNNALVTGYDFLKDSATAMCNRLHHDGIVADCSLIGEYWNAQDLQGALNSRHSAVLINGHTSHYLFDTPDDSVTVDDLGQTTGDHALALFVTDGCHGGLNVPPDNPESSLDLAQALSQLQALYVANTGYGWGYRTAIGLSEQLMLDFVERLVFGTSTTVGRALVSAKQEYYLNEGWFDYYDEKILIENTLYGLPMMRYTTWSSRGITATAIQGSEVTVFEQDRSMVVEEGVTVRSITYSLPELDVVTTEDGVYYALQGQVQASDGKPIQPASSVDISLLDLTAVGVVFRGGTYSEVVSFDPVVEQAITETVTPVEPEPDSQGWDPAFPYQLNHIEWGDTLVIGLGQFNAERTTERLFQSLQFDVYYHTGSDDAEAPKIARMSSSLAGSGCDIAVRASDASGVARVVIAYTNGEGIWASVELSLNEGVWDGAFPANAGTEFFVEVVDGQGNVTIADNAGYYFNPGDGLSESAFVYLPMVIKNP
ncbi:MAG: VCBS repeat-containing protein [Anaerolineae bacterium]|nr:VCBS repeat-containing protein [Anaerolineae bacterium]